MEPLQSLYYGFGNIAYAVAKADDEVQNEEYDKFHDIVSEGLEKHSLDFDYSDIIFHILRGEDMGSDTAYEWGLDSMKLGKSHLTEAKVEDFTQILREVAEAFGSVTPEENDYIQQFRKDMQKLMTKKVG